MAWQDRVREAAYTGPSGTRVTFTYEDVSYSFDKKGTAFEFPEVEGTYVQDLGRTGRRYPLRVIFWGNDYDIEAEAFLDLIRERGAGVLEHPAYGRVDVVPSGRVARNDTLKTSANQAIIDIEFLETTGEIYPSAQTSEVSDVLALVSDFSLAAPTTFAELIDLGTEVNRLLFVNDVASLIDQTATIVRGSAEAGLQAFNTITSSISGTLADITSGVGDVVTLAGQVVALFRSVALPDQAATDLVSVYSAAADSANAFQTRDYLNSCALIAQAETSVLREYPSRRVAVESAVALIDDFDTYVTYRDAAYTDLALTDVGATYQQVQAATATAAGALITISFDLPTEVSFTLDRNRTIIDLVAELYGVIDEELDGFIALNQFTGSEILEVPRGRNVVYYI